MQLNVHHRNLCQGRNYTIQTHSILNANQILHMNIQNNLLCRRTMLRMLIAVGGYHFCNAVSKHRWIATQAFSSHWWKSCTVKMGWDQKKVTWRGGGTPMVIVTVEGPTDLRLNCHMLLWRSIDEALVVGGQWRPKTWASWALHPRPWWQKKDGRHPDDFGWKLGGMYSTR